MDTPPARTTRASADNCASVTSSTSVGGPPWLTLYVRRKAAKVVPSSNSISRSDAWSSTVAIRTFMTAPCVPLAGLPLPAATEAPAAALPGPP